MKTKLLSALFSCLLLGGFLRAQSYTTTTVISGLSNPVCFDFIPDGRVVLTQKGGVSGMAVDAQIKIYSSSFSYIGIFYDLSDSCNSDFERGLLGIAVDPDFATNHYIYVYYNHNYNGDERIRIVRFTEVSNVGTNPTIIFDLDVSNSIAGNHVGGNLHFRPTDPGHIYFTIGDLAYQQGNPTLNYANKLTNPYGKHLRIDKSPLAAPPTDNPYYDDGDPFTGNCDWIWSYGHRNPFDFCFSPVSDSLYSSENGWNTWDEMNMVHRGAFYGWANCEGFYANSSTMTLCSDTNAVMPIEDWGSPLPAVTGILYYSGSVMPEFDNHVLVADNDYGRIYDITLGNAPVYDSFISRTQWMDLTTSGGLTTIKQGADGCIYAMKGGYTSSGNIQKVCPQGMGTEEYQNPYFLLQQNAPNPFSTTTTIAFNMKQDATVRIVLYDIFGREVAVLAEGTQTTGKHELVINAQELGLAPGTYFCSMICEGTIQSVSIAVVE
jgi:glucose/arabinose dehydrogenase